VGLWWTWDSTNIWLSPVATFITSIGVDHTRLLGSNLSQIQRNKMGIMKPNVPCYTPVNNKLMYEWARRKKADVRIIQDMVPTSLPWDHQKQNAALVYHCLIELGYDATNIRAGLLEVEHPGRLQYIRSNILLDGAHNLQWIQSLATYIDGLRPQRKKIVTIFGSSKTDNEVAVFATELIKWDENWLVQPSVYRWLDPATYKDIINLHSLHIEKNPQKALKKVLEWLEEDTLIVIYGSLYLIWEVVSLDIV
jgi:dihydrofolate synthase/folylpolyglutamate synthase